MAFINSIKDFVGSWDKKDFYLYTGIFLGFVLLITLGLIFYSQRTINTLERKIEDVNDLRETKVKTILGKAREVEQQKDAVNAMLAQEKDFNIAGYFKNLLTRLDILANQERFTTQQTERDDDYREDSLSARLVDMNMQKLTELLQEIEQNPRIYSKDLEINKSPKKADAIEVSITIATLQPKTEAVE